MLARVISVVLEAVRERDATTLGSMSVKRLLSFMAHYGSTNSSQGKRVIVANELFESQGRKGNMIASDLAKATIGNGRMLVANETKTQ